MNEDPRLVEAARLEAEAQKLRRAFSDDKRKELSAKYKEVTTKMWEMMLRAEMHRGSGWSYSDEFEAASETLFDIFLEYSQ